MFQKPPLLLWRQSVSVSDMRRICSIFTALIGKRNKPTLLCAKLYFTSSSKVTQSFDFVKKASAFEEWICMCRYVFAFAQVGQRRKTTENWHFSLYNFNNWKWIILPKWTRRALQHKWRLFTLSFEYIPAFFITTDVSLMTWVKSWTSE